MATDTIERTDAVAVAIAGLSAAVDAVFALDPTALSDHQVSALADAVETHIRRAPAMRDALVLEADVRGFAQRKHLRNTAAYLSDRYHLAGGEAHGWVRDAQRFTPSRSLSTGEELPAALPDLAKARRAGRVSYAQTRIVTDFINRLPSTLDPAARARAEQTLVGFAATLDPQNLAIAAQRYLDYLDPDGKYKDPTEVRRRRAFMIGKERDGLTPVSGMLEPWTAEAIRSVLEPLAKPGRIRDCADAHEPAPVSACGEAAGSETGATAGADPDPTASWDIRTTAQRMHDALGEAMRKLLGANLLPQQAGLPATILVLTRLSDLERRTGLASTAHGGLVPVRDVIRRASQAKIIDIVVDDHDNPLFLGRRRRLATQAQRFALVARDRGCVIPGCTVPATRTEAHHLTDFAAGGRTDVDRMALLCPYDHDHIAGWTLYLHNGRIWCIPPPHTGADPTPRLNDYFHPPHPDTG